MAISRDRLLAYAILLALSSSGTCESIPDEAIGSDLCLNEIELRATVVAAEGDDLHAARRLVQHYHACEDSPEALTSWLHRAAVIGTPRDQIEYGLDLDAGGRTKQAYDQYLAAAS